MGGCASKDKKDKVLEGDAAAAADGTTAPAEGAANGEAGTGAANDEAGCVSLRLRRSFGNSALYAILAHIHARRLVLYMRRICW